MLKSFVVSLMFMVNTWRSMGGYLNTFATDPSKTLGLFAGVGAMWLLKEIGFDNIPPDVYFAINRVSPVPNFSSYLRAAGYVAAFGITYTATRDFIRNIRR